MWQSSAKTAVKALSLWKNYDTEVNCYEIFKSKNIVVLDGFAVPEFLGCNDDLQVFEMRIVTPPFILDFAKSRIGRPMEFEEGGREAWEQSCESLFEENWPKVRSLLYSLQLLGIYYYDAKPANIMFKEPGA